MQLKFNKGQISLAVAAFMGTASLVAPPQAAAQSKLPGKYVAGDFHNHTTCSDGAISMQKLVKKSTDKTTDSPWGLDWFVQAGHGGTGNRNCTLVEDESLATPAYPLVRATPGDPTSAVVGPTTTWVNSGVTVKGDISPNPNPPVAGGNAANPNRVMWRWQAVQEFQYQVMEYLNAFKNIPVFLGIESVVAGHEHTSMSVITDQMPASLDTKVLPTSPNTGGGSRYTATGNANALAKWAYCFDAGNSDTSRGNTTGTSNGNNWECSVPGSLNASDPSWSIPAQKLIPAGGNGTGDRGHAKTVVAMKWMKEFHPEGSYYVPAHLERAGPFNPNGNNGFNVEHLRNFNNAAPKVAFGMETQPGHGASSDRGEYRPNRNNFGTTANPNLIDSVGGTTYGGTGVYGAQVGGVWDALLGEGRNFWFFASSDWHNRGIFGPDDRRSTQDFYPGEYQRNYTMVRGNDAKLRPQAIVDGLRTGNNFAASGQLIDRLAFVACASYAGPAVRTNASVEALALAAATANTDVDRSGCATMGEKLVVRPGAEIVVSIVVRDPSGTNYSPYTFSNPSLAQIGINQPLNMPVLDHIDVIRGMVTGYKTPGAADYSGEWPRNTTWLDANGNTADLGAVPAGAKNTSAAVVKTFNKTPGSGWLSAGNDFLKMTFRIPAVNASQYVRLRGTNLPPAVPFETDANGNPLADLFTNGGNTDKLRIPCTATGDTQYNGCPAHLATATSPTSGGTNPIAGQKAVSFDVAAWSDLWFYSNPIYIQVNGGTTVAGVQ